MRAFSGAKTLPRRQPDLLLLVKSRMLAARSDGEISTPASNARKKQHVVVESYICFVDAKPGSRVLYCSPSLKVRSV
jgi:hypothetical protein